MVTNRGATDPPGAFQRLSSRLGSFITVLIVVFVAGCGIRIGAPAEPVPTPDAHEVWRQDAAVAVGTVANASAEAASNAQTDELFRDLSRVSTTYLDHLGGAWTPPPREEDPTPTPPVPTFTSLPAIEAYRAVVEQTSVLAELARTVPGEESAGLASMWLSLHSASTDLAEKLEEPCPTPCTGQPVSQVTSAAETAQLIELVDEHSPELIAIYDALGFTWEVVAARSPENQDTHAATAREYRALAETLSGDLSGTPQDPRKANYQLDSKDPRTTVRALNAASVEFWLAIVPHASPQVRPSLMELMWAAHSQARADHDPLIAWPGML